MVVEQPDAPSGSPRVGRFAYVVVTRTWKWDDEVFRIHGTDPDGVEPTTERVLGAVHPDDRDHVARTLRQATTRGEPFSVCYRLDADDGVERRVVLVCEGGVCDVDTEVPVAQLDGYYIDLTDDFAQVASEEAREAVAASAEHRATIEQAKGSLMLAYGLDADQAFAMLRWWSRGKNMKVRDIAEHLTTVSSAGELTDQTLRHSVDNLLHDASPSAPGS
ncbi:PAS and ANTAR domain-containing protein [Nocardioides sp. BYT-33-1]|uniref:PAS and ANTAR domain-containing protein n=1 Tax=Nocardioides sp. BYT-33-1 TaxID=3416952 RepID=UPI003F52FA42